MKFIKRFLRDEKGQALPLFALLAVVIIGFAGLALDFGLAYTRKANMQKAADAAALASVLDHPGSTIPETNIVYQKTAFDVVRMNSGVEIDKTADVILVNDNEIEVIVPFTVDYYLGRIFGFTQTDTSVKATARKDVYWDGFALPFINMNDQFPTNGTAIKFWEKEKGKESENSGHFELIDKDLMDTASGYVKFDVTKGVTLESGKSIGIYLPNIENILSGPGPYFSFSLHPDILNPDKPNYKQIQVIDKGGKPQTRNLKTGKMENGDTILSNQLVLVELSAATITDGSGNKKVIAGTFERYYEMDKIPVNLSKFGETKSRLVPNKP